MRWAIDTMRARGGARDGRGLLRLLVCACAAANAVCARGSASWEGDRAALLAAKASDNSWFGSSWPASWTDGSDPCEGWEGVTCAGGRVSKMCVAQQRRRPPCPACLGCAQVLSYCGPRARLALPCWGARAAA